MALPTNKVSGKTKSFVDYQNDSTSNDIKLALREGFKSIEHVKDTQQPEWPLTRKNC